MLKKWELNGDLFSYLGITKNYCTLLNNTC